MKRQIVLLVSLFLLVTLSGCVSETDSLLSHALINNNMSELIDAATKGANLDKVRIDGKMQNPILYVWEHNPQPYVIELLLQYGADVNYTDSDGHTLLMYASGYEPERYGFSYVSQSVNVGELTRIFLSHGATIDAKDNSGFAAIDYAAMLFDETDIIKLLLDEGAEITQQTLENAVNTPGVGAYDYDKMALLMQNVASQEIGSVFSSCIVAAMQKKEFSVSEFVLLPTEEQVLALCYTAAFGTPTMLNCVLPQTGGIQSIQDPLGYSLLEIAANEGNYQCVEYLVTSFDWRLEQKQNALYYAIMSGHSSITKKLLDSGATLNAPSDAWYPTENWLLYPAESGDIKTIQLLHNFKYPLSEEIVWYAMKYAARGGSIDVIKFFLNLGYSLYPDFYSVESGPDILYEACAFQQLEVVMFLVEVGINANSINEGLAIAVEQHNLELINYLLSVGAEPTAKTVFDDGSASISAYDLAIQYGMEDVISLFDEASNYLDRAERES